jgi:predicted phosphodiesterase
VRVAVVSDIHSNLHALEAVLGAIDAEAPDELWCLGDLVGYGPRPNECCAAIAERADVCLAGNHDLAVRGTIDLAEFHGDAGVAASWTRGVLQPEWQALLERLEPEGTAHGVALYHGSARDPIWEYVLRRRGRRDAGARAIAARSRRAQPRRASGRAVGGRAERRGGQGEH